MFVLTLVQFGTATDTNGEVTVTVSMYGESGCRLPYMQSDTTEFVES